MSGEGFISRWSRKKTEAKTESKATAGPNRPPDTTARGQAHADAVPAQAGTQSPPSAAPPAPEPLPPLESLTSESDFTPFMKPGVDADIRRTALKTLLRDPRFNVMDGLDVYIDDYSKPDPLPEGWLEQMTQTVRLGEYRDPDRQAPEPDAENAQKTAQEAQDHADANAENDVREQVDTQPEALPAADTPVEGSTGAKVKELPSAR
jgi:uncharacterized protein DUF3306